jgi:hypothetical protein
MKGPSDRELTACEKKNRHQTDARGCVSRLAEKLRKARRIARDSDSSKERSAHSPRSASTKGGMPPRPVSVSQTDSTRKKLEPKWLGPYQVIRKISDLVYRIQSTKREVNLHIEQLKLCRASREELRERRRQNKRRMREKRPRPEREDGEEMDYDDSASEGYDDRLQLSYTPRESQPTTEQNRRVSGNASSDEERVTEPAS